MGVTRIDTLGKSGGAARKGVPSGSRGFTRVTSKKEEKKETTLGTKDKPIILKKGESFRGGRVVKEREFQFQEGRKLTRAAIERTKAKVQRTRIIIDNATGRQVGLLRFRGGTLGSETEVEVFRERKGKLKKVRTVRGIPEAVKQDVKEEERFITKKFGTIRKPTVTQLKRKVEEIFKGKKLTQKPVVLSESKIKAIEKRKSGVAQLVEVKTGIPKTKARIAADKLAFIKKEFSKTNQDIKNRLQNIPALKNKQNQKGITTFFKELGKFAITTPAVLSDITEGILKRKLKDLRQADFILNATPKEKREVNIEIKLLQKKARQESKNSIKRLASIHKKIITGKATPTEYARGAEFHISALLLRTGFAKTKNRVAIRKRNDPNKDLTEIFKEETRFRAKELKKDIKDVRNFNKNQAKLDLRIDKATTNKQIKDLRELKTLNRKNLQGKLESVTKAKIESKAEIGRVIRLEKKAKPTKRQAKQLIKLEKEGTELQKVFKATKEAKANLVLNKRITDLASRQIRQRTRGGRRVSKVKLRKSIRKDILTKIESRELAIQQESRARLKQIELDRRIARREQAILKKGRVPKSFRPIPSKKGFLLSDGTRTKSRKKFLNDIKKNLDKSKPFSTNLKTLDTLEGIEKAKLKIQGEKLKRIKLVGKKVDIAIKKSSIKEITTKQGQVLLLKTKKLKKTLVVKQIKKKAPTPPPKKEPSQIFKDGAKSKDLVKDLKKSIPKSKASLILLAKISESVNEKIKSKVRSKLSFKDKAKVIQKPKQVLSPVEKVVDKISNKIIALPKTGQTITTNTITNLINPPAVSQDTTTQTTTRQSTTSKKLRKVLSKISKSDINKIKKKVIALQLARQGFDVFVKRKQLKKGKGKFFSRGFKRVNSQSLRKTAALGLGAKTVDKFTNRTFQIKKTQTRVPRKRPDLRKIWNTRKNKFRPAKRNPRLFTEKSKFAIDSRTEKRGIPFEAARLRRLKRR